MMKSGSNQYLQTRPNAAEKIGITKHRYEMKRAIPTPFQRDHSHSTSFRGSHIQSNRHFVGLGNKLDKLRE